MEITMQKHGVAAIAFAVAMAIAPIAMAQSPSATSQVKRGEYLATFGGCHDCHSPKVMTPNGPAPDKTRLLSGHPAASPLPAIPSGVVGAAPNQWAALTNGDLTAWVGPWGVSFAANLTPDKATGLGGWTVDQFIKTMRTGKHLGVGRPILPPMPWFDVAVLSDADLKALFAYLRSVPPVQNPVPVPIPPKS
jgi:mono/diheme cytochrome c family protein